MKALGAVRRGRLHEGPLGRDRLVAALLAPGALLLLVLLMDQVGTPLALGALVVMVAGLFLVAFPQTATLAFVFLLYTNIPVVLHTLHGVPQPLTAAFILLLGIPLLHSLFVRQERLRVDPVLGLMFAFLLVLLSGSFLAAADTGLALTRVFVFVSEGIVLYWLLVNVIRTPVVLRKVIWAALAASTLLGSLAIYQSVTRSYDQQFFGLAERALQFEDEREADVRAGRAEDRLYTADRADGPLLGKNRYAQTSIVLLPLAMFLFMTGSTPRLRMAALVAGVVTLVGGVVLTYSRGAFVTLALMFVGAACVRWIRPTRALFVVVLAIPALAFAAPVLYDRVASLGGVASLDDPAAADGPIRGRATEMLAALHAFRDHPIIGVGPGQYAPFHSVEYQQIPEIKFRDIRHSRRAHTMYFEMGAETGVIGLAIFMAIPLLLMRGLWGIRQRWRGRDPDRFHLATALVFSLAAYLVSALFLSLAYQRYYWFLIALAGAGLHVLGSERNEDPVAEKA